MGENGPRLSEDSGRVYDLQDLVSRVKAGELRTMSSDEVDALDEAIELGLVNEDELHVQGDANAA